MKANRLLIFVRVIDVLLLFQRGDVATARDEIKCDDDWEWTSEWLVDLNRAVDEDGM